MKKNNQAVIYMHSLHTAALRDCICILYTAVSEDVLGGSVTHMNKYPHTPPLSDLFPLVTVLLKGKWLPLYL